MIYRCPNCHWMIDSQVHYYTCEKETTSLMATTSKTSGYRRASDFVEGIGKSLDEIENKDVLLVKFSITERTMEGEKRPIVLLTLALDPDKPEDTTLFHAWSESLATRLSEIPNDALPLIIAFEQTRTRSGFKVWTFR